MLNPNIEKQGELYFGFYQESMRLPKVAGRFTDRMRDVATIKVDHPTTFAYSRVTWYNWEDLEEVFDAKNAIVDAFKALYKDFKEDKNLQVSYETNKVALADEFAEYLVSQFYSVHITTIAVGDEEHKLITFDCDSLLNEIEVQ